MIMNLFISLTNTTAILMIFFSAKLGMAYCRQGPFSCTSKSRIARNLPLFLSHTSYNTRTGRFINEVAVK